MRTFHSYQPAATCGSGFSIAGAACRLAPRYNVAPSQLVAVVERQADGSRGLVWLKWGLVPHWSPDGKPKVKPINARAETLLEKPTFRNRSAQTLSDPHRWVL